MLKFTNNVLLKEQVLRSNTWGHHFFFLNCILAIIIGSTYVYAAPHTESFTAFVYLAVTWLGQISFLAFLAFLIFLFPLTFIGNFKVYKFVSIVIAVLLHCLLLVDAKLFLAIKVHLTWMVSSLMLRDLDFNTGLNFNFLYIAIVLLIALELFFAKLSTREIYKKETRHNYFPAILLSIVGFCFISSHGLYIWADAVSYEKITNLRSVFPAHYPMTAKTFLNNHGWLDGESDEHTYLSNSSFNYPLAEIKVEAKDPLHNVVYIFANGVSYSDLDAVATPKLFELKQNNLSFESHFLPYRNLEDNMFATAFGLPIEYRDDFLSHDVKPITVDVLGNLEYYVRLFSSSPITNDLVPIAKYLGIAKNKTNFVTSDEAVFTNAKEFIDSLASNQHFILNLNTSSLEKNLNDAQRKIALRQLDHQIATFVEELQDKELLNNTYVVITSSLGNGNIEKQYASFYSIKKQHVPLIVITPNESNKGVSITKLTSAFDFVPTLGIEILGIKTPYVNYAIGNNLFSKEEKPYFVSTGGNELLLISKEKVTNYKKNGKAYIFKDGTKQNARTNLEDLIKAMRELNRFKG